MFALTEDTGGTREQTISLSGRCREILLCHCNSGSLVGADYSESESVPTLR